MSEHRQHISDLVFMDDCEQCLDDRGLPNMYAAAGGSEQ